MHSRVRCIACSIVVCSLPPGWPGTMMNVLACAWLLPCLPPAAALKQAQCAAASTIIQCHNSRCCMSYACRSAAREMTLLQLQCVMHCAARRCFLWLSPLLQAWLAALAGPSAGSAAVTTPPRITIDGTCIARMVFLYAWYCWHRGGAITVRVY